MKNTRAWVMLGLALLAGVLAVAMAARWMTTRTGATAQLVVAARDIELGAPLDAANLTTIAWPGAVMPEGGFRETHELEGRVVKSTVARGEPVLESKLAPKGTRGGLSAVIGDGKRAITVHVNEVMGVAGFALPGSFVDVMVHTTLDDDRRGQGVPVSKIVLERILVLAVAQEAGRDETRPKVVNAVTLEVTPEQAERLDLARSVGNLSLVLRNQMDQNAGNTTGSGKSDLFAGQLPPPAALVTAPAAVAPPPAAPSPRRPVARAAPAVAVAPPAPSSPPAPPVAVAPATAEPPREAAPKVEVIRGVQRSEVEL